MREYTMSAIHAGVVTETSPPPQSIAASRLMDRTVRVPWQRLTLALIALLAAFLNFYQLDQVGWGNSYYAAAVRSMLQSWHNFFFVSFDPGGFVTIDKPPVGF